MSGRGSPQSYTSTVPTAAERAGDFSALTNIASTYQIYDPFTTRPAATAGRYQRDPFPGNIIPQNRFDKAGFSLANLYPLPNQPGNRDGTNNYYYHRTVSASFPSCLTEGVHPSYRRLSAFIGGLQN